MTLPTVTIKGKDFGGTFPCNLAAVYRLTNTDTGGQLYAISLAATAQEVQAISAGLADASMGFSWNVRDTGFAKESTCKLWDAVVHPASGGFDCRKQKLEYDTWHLVAVSKDPKFFLHETDEALWRVIRSDKYTTPVLKAWTPAIRGQLHQKGYLKRCDFFGACNASYLLATDKTLDKVVSEGVRDGLLQIQPVAEAA